jgi:hypothetical protein
MAHGPEEPTAACWRVPSGSCVGKAMKRPDNLDLAVAFAILGFAFGFVGVMLTLWEMSGQFFVWVMKP